jgi:hypothetical protein
VQDGLVAGRGAFLRQEAEVGAALPLDGALVGRLLAEDEVEQGGFARAVGADEAERSVRAMKSDTSANSVRVP